MAKRKPRADETSPASVMEAKVMRHGVPIQRESVRADSAVVVTFVDADGKEKELARVSGADAGELRIELRGADVENVKLDPAPTPEEAAKIQADRDARDAKAAKSPARKSTKSTASKPAARKPARRTASKRTTRKATSTRKATATTTRATPAGPVAVDTGTSRLG